MSFILSCGENQTQVGLLMPLAIIAITTTVALLLGRGEIKRLADEYGFTEEEIKKIIRRP